MERSGLEATVPQTLCCSSGPLTPRLGEVGEQCPVERPSMAEVVQTSVRNAHVMARGFKALTCCKPDQIVRVAGLHSQCHVGQ